MQDPAGYLRCLSVGATAPQADHLWARSPLSGLGDAALVAAVAEAISPPKRDADTSFLTHAPLELLARAALLAMVAPSAREPARWRIARIAADYAQAGDEIEPPQGADAFHDDQSAFAALARSFEDGDPETADAAALFLARRAAPAALAERLAETVAPQLGAAGHAPILLAEFARAEGRLDGIGELLRAPARAIARERVRLGWHKVCVPAYEGGAEQELMRRLADTRPIVSPSPYIAPTMRAVESDGVAEAILGDVTERLSLAAARRALLRVAALSMLQDDEDSAAYGWSHALTMPLAVLATARAANPTAMIRIAATQSLGFRATMGKTRLDLAWRPEAGRTASLWNADPSAAASAAYHWPTDDRTRLKSQLATRASTLGDAHLAKYTLAAFDAAAADPGAAPLYLAAAAYLGAWWDAHPEACFE